MPGPLDGAGLGTGLADTCPHWPYACWHPSPQNKSPKPQDPNLLQQPDGHARLPPLPWPHCVPHVPQSDGQSKHDSPALHTPLPHGFGGLLDGAGVLEADPGVGLHTPYPCWHPAPQSASDVPHHPLTLQQPCGHTCSPPAPGPHSKAHDPQSYGHVAHVSEDSHKKFPHVPGRDGDGDATGAGDDDGAGVAEGAGKQWP